MAAFNVHREQPGNGFGHVDLFHRRSDHRTQRCVRAGRAANGDLVPGFAALVDTKYADVANMVVSAGIHAARHLDVEFAQVVLVIVIVETIVDEFRDVDGAGIGEAAEIEPRAADHVGEGADVGRREAGLRQGLPQLEGFFLLDVREQ